MRRSKYNTLFLILSIAQLGIGIFVFNSTLIQFLVIIALCLFEYLVLATLRYYQTGKKPFIVFMGSTAQGGIGTYMKDAKKYASNLNIHLYPTHVNGGLFFTIPTFIISYTRLFLTEVACIFTSTPLILHLHMATKGSFIRKYTIAATLSLFADALVLHIHGGETPQFFEMIIRKKLAWFLSFFFSLFTKIVIVSETLKQEIITVLRRAFIPIDETRVEVIHNSTDVPRILPTPKTFKSSEVLELITVARADPEKNVLLLPQIAQILKNNKVPAHITHIGPGSQLEELKRLVIQLKLETYLSIVGNIPHEQIDSFYQKAHITLLPSHAESFGIVVLEGYKNGNAAITSNVGGLKDIVDEGKTGFRCEPNDAAMFAKRITYLSEHPDILAEMQAVAQIKVQQFSHEYHAQQLAAFYATLTLS